MIARRLVLLLAAFASCMEVAPLAAQQPTYVIASVAPNGPISLDSLTTLALGLHWEIGEAGSKALSITEQPGVSDSLRAWIARRWILPVEQDLPGHPTASPSWGRDSTHAPLAWPLGYRGNGMLAATIDGGIEAPQRLNTHIVAEINASYDGGPPDDATDLSGGASRCHGCWVHSAMGSTDYGVAPDLQMLVCKGAYNIAGVGFGMYTSSAITCVNRLVALGATIISISYDMPCGVSLSQAVADAAQHGVLVVASTGNSGAAAPACPAADTANTLAVMADDQSGQLASFSNRGGQLSAPGVSVDAYGGTKSGTSMAAPYGAAVAGEVLGACGAMPPAALKRLLTTNTNNGRVDASRAIAACKGGLIVVGPTVRTYTTSQSDTARVLWSVPWSVSSSRSSAVRCGDLICFTAVANDSIRIIRP